MKKLILWAGCMAGLLLAACSSAEDRKSGSLETIPVADAFGNLQPLKVSDFLGRIRYVALETNDSVLVGVNRDVEVICGSMRANISYKSMGISSIRCNSQVRNCTTMQCSFVFCTN